LSSVDNIKKFTHFHLNIVITSCYPKLPLSTISENTT